MDTPSVKKARQVLDLFGPIVETLPTVIEALQDIEKLEKHRNNVATLVKQEKAVLEKAMDNHQAELLKMEKARLERVEQFNEMERKGQQEITALVTKRKEVSRKLTEVTKNLKDAEQEASTQMSKIAERVSKEAEDAYAQLEVHKEYVASEIEKLDKKHAEALKKLSTLKSSLG